MLQNARPGPQPFLNFYARPVAGPAEVDAAHAKIWENAISPVARGLERAKSSPA